MAQITSTIADFRLYPQQSQTLTFNFSLPASATNVTAAIYFHVKQVNGHGFSIFDGTAYASTKQVFGVTASYMDRDFTVLHTDRNGFTIRPGDTSHQFFARMDAGGEDYYYFTNVRLVITYTENSHSITCAVSPSGGGTLTASKNNANTGEQITLTPSPATGYQFTGWSSSPSVSISNNRFTMPDSNVTITAIFSKVSYSVSKSVSPTGGGTVTTSATSAVMGTTITLGNTPATGYVFDHYTVNGSTISGNTFSMPAGSAAVVAYFTRLTTGTAGSKELTPGINTVVTLTQTDNSLTHQIVITFGSHSKTINVAAGVRTVNIQPDVAWANSIPNASVMTGGVVTVKTLKSGTVIGQTTIASDFRYNVPQENGYPTMTVQNYITHTVAGHTYPSVGAIFVQGKTGLQTILSNCAGAYGSTVVRTEIWMVGYAGEDYTKTGTGAMTFNSGLLTRAGTLQVKAKITDSRGRSMTYTYNYTVYAYADPAGTLTVYRCTQDGTPSDDGLYARYEFTCSFSAIGSNTLTRELSIDGHTLSLSTNSGNGWVLGDTHYQYPILEAHDLFLTLTDAFVTKSVSVTIPSQRFLIHFSADGTSVAIGQSATTGSDRFTIAQGMTVYIGSRTLEQYIHDVMGS